MGKSADKHPVISIILPVYNVAGYIDVCMDSILAQTFGDFEALLIDDGSTDGSADLCDRWGQADPRIRVIHQENRGVSGARNRGIDEARGEWLAFVDPDDWLNPQYLEKLYEAAVKNHADFAECDVWRVNGKTGKMNRRSCSGTMGELWNRADHMKYGATASYKAISRKSLWTDNHIAFPDCAFESPAVYALILALARKIVNIDEPLYYYRLFRPESLIETGYAHRDGKANNTLGIEAMRHLISEFKRLGLYEQYKDALKGIVVYRLSDILATQFYRKSPEDYAETVCNFRAFLKEAFPDLPQPRYLTFGGYNLNRIMVHPDMLHDPYGRFNFMSVPAAACGSEPQAAGGEDQPFVVRHPNRYREMMLQREETGAFESILQEVQPEYLFIDLIEERFDFFVRTDTDGENARYVTASDARESAEDPGPYVRRIGGGSTEYREIFRKSSRALIDRVREISPQTRVVVIENYLAESFGTLQKRQMYENIKEVRRINTHLKACYGMLREASPEAVWIAPLDDGEIRELYFTDEHYRYGAVPSHLNEIVNRKIAGLVQSRLTGDQR